MNNIDKLQAVLSLRPKALFYLTDDVLTWDLEETQTQPTDSEITAEISRLQTEYDAKQYARDRAEAYPSLADQLDDIYHNGIDGWKAEIKAVKDKYPKG